MRGITESLATSAPLATPQSRQGRTHRICASFRRDGKQVAAHVSVALHVAVALRLVCQAEAWNQVLPSPERSG